MYSIVSGITADKLLSMEDYSDRFLKVLMVQPVGLMWVNLVGSVQGEL